MAQLRLSLRRAALSVACLAPVPYVVLKLLWLSGSTIGTTNAAGASEMSDTRFVVGNAITVVLMLVAVVFAIALTRSWARRVPGWIVFILGAGATGLLAPILLGLPLGLVLQLAVDGAVRPADDTGLAPWVFGTVYSGFGLLGLALAVLLAEYVVARWGDLITVPPQRPSALSAVTGALGLIPFGAANIVWGVFGPGSSGPQGMDLPAQRTVLVVTGILCLAAFVVPLAFARAAGWPRIAWLVTWTGCCVAAFQGPTQILLAQGGDVQPVIALIALLATPGSCIYGLGLLLSARARVRVVPDTGRNSVARMQPASVGTGTARVSVEPVKERPMGAGDKAKNAAKATKGKAKEMTGDATDNRDLQAEGQAEKSKADLKQAGQKAKDAFKK